MMAILSETYYISGLRSIARKIARSCVSCRQANAITCHQKMGQLPRQRVNFSAPFQEVEVDYAGSFLVNRGNLGNQLWKRDMSQHLCVHVLVLYT